MSGVQLPLGPIATDALPLDPTEVAALTGPERARLYSELELDFEQRLAIEDAVRRVVAGSYGRSPR